MRRRPWEGPKAQRNNVGIICHLIICGYFGLFLDYFWIICQLFDYFGLISFHKILVGVPLQNFSYGILALSVGQCILFDCMAFPAMCTVYCEQ